MKKTTQIINDQIQKYISIYNDKYSYQRRQEYDYDDPATGFPQVTVTKGKEYFAEEPNDFTRSYMNMRKSIENTICDDDDVDEAVNNAVEDSAFNAGLATFEEFGLNDNKTVHDYLLEIESNADSINDCLKNLDCLYNELLPQLKQLIRDADNRYVIELFDLNSDQELQKDIIDEDGTLVTGTIEDGDYDEVDEFCQALRGIRLVCSYIFDKKADDDFVMFSNDILDDLANKYIDYPSVTLFDTDDPIIVAKDSLKAIYVFDEDNQEKVLQNPDSSDLLSKIYKEESNNYINKPLELYKFFLEERASATKR